MNIESLLREESNADFREGYDFGYRDGREDERGIRVSALLVGSMLGATTVALLWWLL